MFGGMGAINSNLVIRSKTKGEMLEFLVLITACVLQRQWAKAQLWHSSGGMFICCSFRGRVACRNCDTFLCHPALPLTRSHTGALFARTYATISPKHIRKMCATSGYCEPSVCQVQQSETLWDYYLTGMSSDCGVQVLVGPDLCDSPSKLFAYLPVAAVVCMHSGMLHPAVRYHYRQYMSSRSL